MSVKLFKHKIQAYEMPAETDKARILAKPGGPANSQPKG